MVSELKIVLASSSPRRISLLKELGLEFSYVDPRGKENNTIKDPVKRVEHNSCIKAKSLVGVFENSLIIGSDTVVTIKDRILGKPLDEDDARKMLKDLSGRCNKVYTGITIVNSNTCKAITRYAVTKVWFKDLSDTVIDAYIDSGEPLDKAGAYGIQGIGRELIERFEGSLSNVIGFPLELFSDMLDEI